MEPEATGAVATAYQPIVNLRAGNVCGWEALIRAHHVEGAILPLALISSARQHGLLDELTRRVIDDAWHTLTQATDVVETPLMVSINLELTQLDPASPLLRWLAAIVWPEGVRVVVEVTERGGDLWTAAHESAATLLESQGIELAIDDYGAGSARMSFLNTRQWHLVKMDGQFLGGGYLLGMPIPGAVLLSRLRRGGLASDLDV